jgi:hypothetical protein
MLDHFIVDLFGYFDLVDCIFNVYVVCVGAARYSLQRLAEEQFRPRYVRYNLAPPMEDSSAPCTKYLYSALNASFTTPKYSAANRHNLRYST